MTDTMNEREHLGPRIKRALEIGPADNDTLASRIADVVVIAGYTRAQPVADERVAEIEALANAATPGPWHFVEENAGLMSDHGYGLLYGHAEPGSGGWEKNLYVSVGCSGNVNRALGEGAAEANAAFIAHAREDIPYLLSAYRAALARVGELEQSLSHANDVVGLEREARTTATATIDALTEAGKFCCGWHPTDPKHPAFFRTQEYGQSMMAALLGGASIEKAREHAAVITGVAT